MRMVRVAGRHLGKHTIHIRRQAARYALVQNGGDRDRVRLHPWRKPQRSTKVALKGPCRSGREGRACERANEPTEMDKISLRIAIHPARDRVRREGPDHNADRRLHIGWLSGNNAASVLVHTAGTFSSSCFDEMTPHLSRSASVIAVEGRLWRHQNHGPDAHFHQYSRALLCAKRKVQRRGLTANASLDCLSSLRRHELQKSDKEV